MPRFNLGIDLETAREAGLAEGFSSYSGPLPPPGSYKGILKMVRLKEIQSAKNKGAHRLQIGVEIQHPDYEGFFAMGGVNLIEGGYGFVNQFLNALGDGSEAKLLELQKALFGPGPQVNDEGINTEVLAIGSAKIDSPKGERPIIVTLKKHSYKPDGSDTWVETRQIGEYLPPNTDMAASSGTVSEGEDVVEESDIGVDVETSDATSEDVANESIFEEVVED